MGVLSFVEGLQRQKLERELADRELQQRELDRQNRLAEIQARTQGTLSEQANAARLAEEAIKNEAARQWMTTAKSGIQQREDLAANLVHQGMDPQEALVEAAHQQHMIRAEPELVKATSARGINEFNTGRIPLMSTLGQTTTQADITGEKAREGENLNKYLTSAETRTTAPMAARAGQEASIAGSRMQETAANAAVPLLPKVTSAQQLSDIAGAGLKTAQAGQQQQVLSGVNPALQSQAENAANKAAAVRSGLETSSGGLITPGLANQALVNPMAPRPIQDLISQIVTSAAAAAPTPTNAIPTRPGVLFNLNNLTVPSH